MPARSVNRRAQLLRATLSPKLAGKTLQHYLATAVKAPLDLDKTALESAQFGTLRINSDPKTKGGVLLLKIVGHAGSEQATTVPLKRSAATKEESAAAPPKDTAFKNCDFFLAVRDDWVMGIGHHMRIETAVKYIRQLLVTNLKEPLHAAMDTAEVFNYNTAKKLESEGLRSLDFTATLMTPTVHKLKEDALRGPVKSLVAGLKKTLGAVAKQDADPAALADLSVAVSISVNNGIHGNLHAQQAIYTAAKGLLSESEENDDGGIVASIVTKKGSRIALSSATVSKPYRLQLRANENSLIDLEVWAALEDFDGYVKSLSPMTV